MKHLETIKWTGTVVLIIGSFVNGFGYYPLGPIILTLGGVAWLTASIMMRDRALIITNTVMMLASIIGLIYTAIN